MVNKKVVCISCIIAFLIMGVILYIKAVEFDKSFIIGEIVDNTVKENVIENDKVDNEKDENNTASNNTTEENIVGQEELESQNEASNAENDATSDDLYAGLTGKEKAIAMAKKQWGENDSTVYYFVDRTSGNIYNISVRSKATTESLAEYEIDIKNNTIK